jgi:hypothetical protein
MKPVICIYCEGTDTKVVAVTKEKDKIKVLKAGTFDLLQPAVEFEDSLSGLQIDSGELSLEGATRSPETSSNLAKTGLAQVSDMLRNLNPKNCLFLPALTEPAIYYHIFEGSKIGKSSKLVQDIINDIQESKNVTIEKENLSYVELADKSLLTVFINSEAGCIKVVKSIAQYNGRRYYKIPSVKSAEISLAYYIAKRKKFFPDDQSLIVYIGKEYSKLIFLQGRKIKHIGATLDIGTINLHTYDVYFSKILLEMENGGIQTLDNIIVCGEDDSENLILSFYGTFPEANVSKLEFEELDLSSLKQDVKDKFSSYSIPLATTIDYLDEVEEIHKGINLLPKYVREDQKVFQFAWHGFAILPLLFLAAFLITMKVLNNQKEIKELTNKIEEKSQLLKENQAILGKISDLQAKIDGFSQTQAILDSASVGTGIWSKAISEISLYFAGRKNIWLTRLTRDETGQVSMEGYALTKSVLTDFAYSLKYAEIKSVNYEALRDKNTYKFIIILNISNFQKELE